MCCYLAQVEWMNWGGGGYSFHCKGERRLYRSVIIADRMMSWRRRRRWWWWWWTMAIIIIISGRSDNVVASAWKEINWYDTKNLAQLDNVCVPFLPSFLLVVIVLLRNNKWNSKGKGKHMPKWKRRFCLMVRPASSSSAVMSRFHQQPQLRACLWQ